MPSPLNLYLFFLFQLVALIFFKIFYILIDTIILLKMDNLNLKQIGKYHKDESAELIEQKVNNH